MLPEIIQTSDGSDTILNHDLNQHYHSVHGAVQESQHIFIEAGFRAAAGTFFHDGCDDRSALRIFEMGFGTGLNALLTLREAEKSGIRVHYTAIEAWPLEEQFWAALNYPQLPGFADMSTDFARIHTAGWNMPVKITDRFTLFKIHGHLEDYQPEAGSFRLVYFDAFDPEAQPELWTDTVFVRCFRSLVKGGIFVTYSVKGRIVRSMKAAGFVTEKLPGPPGKRHILRAMAP